MHHLPADFPVAGVGYIRQLREEDLRALEWHGGPDLRSFYARMWKNHVQGESTVLVAEFNRFPIGQIVIHWSGKPAHLDFPDQQSLRVHPAFRGMGLGTALISASEKCVLESGYANVGLSVNISNHKARRLYERLGYSVSGGAYEDRWDYINANGEQVWLSETVLDMVKKLVPARGFPQLAERQR